jgi:diguanylate cyclase (GGDEF)-like protein/PAS domain S-box-containing protein
MKRLVSRLEKKGDLIKKNFSNDSSAYINDFHGFIAIEYVDERGIVKWITPIKNNEVVSNKNLNFDLTRKKAMESARTYSQAVMTKPIKLRQGGVGILTFYPIYIQGKFKGYILSVLDTKVWLKLIFNSEKTILRYLDLTVLIGDIKIYEQNQIERGQKNVFVLLKELGGIELKFVLSPSSNWFFSNKHYWTEYILFFGFCFSILIGFLVYGFNRLSYKTWQNRIEQKMRAYEREKKETIQKQLSALQEQYDLAIGTAEIGIWIWNLKTKKLHWNSNMFPLYGVSNDMEPSYELWRSLVISADRGHADALVQDAIEGRKAFNTVFKIKTPSGIYKYIKANAKVVRDNSGAGLYFIGVNFDITPIQKLNDIVLGTEIGVWELNLEKAVVSLEYLLQELLGYPKNSMPTLNRAEWEKRIHPEDLILYRAKIAKCIYRELTSFECELRLMTKSGKWKYFLNRAKVLINTDGGEPLIISGIVQDISDRKESEKKIRYFENHDELTKLPNRRLARDRIDQTLQQANRYKQKFAILFIDVDRLKSVNDEFGHAVGDILIKTIANKIKESIRDSDTLARIGGDEFLAILPDIHYKKNVQEIIKKIENTFKSKLKVGEQYLVASVSIGITIYPDNGVDIDELIKLADEQMYKKKALKKKKNERAQRLDKD